MTLTPHLIADVKDLQDTKIIVMMEFEDADTGNMILDDGADALYERDTPIIRIPAIITNLLATLYPEEEIKKRIKKGMRNIAECRRREIAENDLIKDTSE